MPIELHPGIDEIAIQLQVQLGAAWRNALKEIIDRWTDLDEMGRLNAVNARSAVKEVLVHWPGVTASRYGDMIDRIFSFGFAMGVIDTGVKVQPDAGDQMAVKWLKENQHGFVPALKNITEHGIQKIEGIIGDAYAGRNQLGDERPFDLDDMVRRVVEEVDITDTRAELIVRTETAKATALGRIASWGDDPYRDWYWYEWIATPDERVKDVSLLFEREGPYTYSQIKHRWEVDHNHPQRVKNRKTGNIEYQVSAYNCRCTVARVPKAPSELLSEGKITQDEYERMEAA